MSVKLYYLHLQTKNIIMHMYLSRAIVRDYKIVTVFQKF